MASWVAKQGYDKKAIDDMKPVIHGIEQATREAVPASGLNDEEQHSRSAILSALGSLGSVDPRRLSNPEYAATIQESIDLVTTGSNSPSARNDHIQSPVREKVVNNPVAKAGLAQLEAAIFSSKAVAAQR